MLEENKKKKRCKGSITSNLNGKPSKEEIVIARYLRSKLPIKEGKLAQMTVLIFDGSEAVNILMESKWATGQNRYPLLFTNRHYAVDYMNQMLMKNLFHRAMKIKKKSKKKGDEKPVSSKKKNITNGQTEEKKDSAKDTKKKSIINKDGKKARMKLEFHEVQEFNPDDPEGDDVYVWIYEPFNPWKFLLGGLVLLVILGFCLFPIWPSELRSVAYYGSIGCMGVLGVLVALVILRAILFGMIWVTTFGQHHFWLLPNLTEDCGVLESFKPLYLYESKKSKTKKLKQQQQQEQTKDKGLTSATEEEGGKSVQEEQEENTSTLETDNNDFVKKKNE